MIDKFNMNYLISLWVFSVVFHESLAKNIPVAWNNRAHQAASVCRKPGGQCLDDHTLHVCTGDLRPVVTVDCRARRQGPYCNSDHNKCWGSPAEDQVEDRGRCPGQGLYPDPSDCRKYYDCSEARGAYETYTCSENEYFHFKSQKCKTIEDHDDCNNIDCRRRWGRFVKLEDSNRLYALCDPNSINSALFECPRKKEFNTSIQKCTVDSSEESESSEEIDDDVQPQYLSTTLHSGHGPSNGIFVNQKEFSSGSDDGESVTMKTSVGESISNEESKQKVSLNTNLEQVLGAETVGNSGNTPVDSIIDNSPNNQPQGIHWDNTGNLESEQAGKNVVTESNDTPGKGTVVDPSSGNFNVEFSSLNPQIDSSDNESPKIVNNNESGYESLAKNTNIGLGYGKDIIGAGIQDVGKGDTKVAGSPGKNKEEAVISDKDSENHSPETSAAKEKCDTGTDINVSEISIITSEIITHNTANQDVNGDFPFISNEKERTTETKDVGKLINSPNENTAAQEKNNKQIIANENQEASALEDVEQAVVGTNDGSNVRTDSVSNINIATSQAVMKITENSVKQGVNSESSIISNESQNISVTKDATQLIGSDMTGNINTLEPENYVGNAGKQAANIDSIIQDSSQQTSDIKDVKETADGPIENGNANTDVVGINTPETETDNASMQGENAESSMISNDSHPSYVSNVSEQLSGLEQKGEISDGNISTDIIAGDAAEKVNGNTPKQEANGEGDIIETDSQQTSTVNDFYSAGQVVQNPGDNSDVVKDINSEASSISDDIQETAIVHGIKNKVKTPDDNHNVGTDTSTNDIIESETVTENTVKQEANGEVNYSANSDQQTSAADGVKQVVQVSENNSDVSTSADNNVIKANSETVTENTVKQDVNSEVTNISNDDQQISTANNVEKVVTLPEITSDVGTENVADDSANKAESATVTSNTAKHEVNSDVSDILNEDQQTSATNGVEQVLTIPEITSDINTEISADNSEIQAESETVSEKTEKQAANGEVSNISNDNQLTSATNGVEKMVTIPEINSDVRTETSADNSAHEVESEIVTENIVKGQVSNISKHGQQTSEANGIEHVVKVPSEKTKEGSDKIIENDSIALAPENNNQVTVSQVVNGPTISNEPTLLKDDEATTAMTTVDVNTVTDSTNSNDGVTENNVNRENDSEPSIIYNDNQSAASVDSTDPITGDEAQTSENKVLHESGDSGDLDNIEGIDDAQNGTTEAPIDNAAPVELQLEVVNGDVQKFDENADVATEDYTVSTVTPVESNEKVNGPVSDNNQLNEHSTDDLTSHVETTEPPSNAEINAEGVNQKESNNGDDTQSSDAASNDGSSALVPETTSDAELIA